MNDTQTIFYGNKDPHRFSVGDLWFSENAIHVAKNQKNDIVWVEKR